MPPPHPTITAAAPEVRRATTAMVRLPAPLTLWSWKLDTWRCCPRQWRQMPFLFFPANFENVPGWETFDANCLDFGSGPT